MGDATDRISEPRPKRLCLASRLHKVEDPVPGPEAAKTGSPGPKEDERTLRKKARGAEKKAAKATKRAAKNRKAAKKEVAKAEKEAAKATKLAAKGRKKAKKEVAKAEKEAAKATKLSAKGRKKAKKEAAKLPDKEGAADEEPAKMKNWKALMQAVAYGDEAAVQGALAQCQGAEVVNRADNYGRTALWLAVYRGDGAAVTRLINAGASVNQESNKGSTPLHESAFSFYGKEAGVKALGGTAPLPEAVLRGKEACTKALLKAGADPRVKDKHGRTARDRARQEGFQKIAAMLRGAEEEWARAIILQVSAQGTELSFRTLDGRIAATLTWSNDRPAAELPAAVFEAIRSSSFQAHFEPLRVGNLRFVPQGLPGRMLDTSPCAVPVLEQLKST